MILKLTPRKSHAFKTQAVAFLDVLTDGDRREPVSSRIDRSHQPTPNLNLA